MIYGPYKRLDGRWIIIIDGKTKSYPKYLYEKHHNTVVEEPNTIDHIDGNPDNNNIDNLQILSRAENASKETIKSVLIPNKYTGPDNSGMFNGMAKLMDWEVRQYRELYETNKMSKQQIIQATKLPRRTVENFLNYKTYTK